MIFSILTQPRDAGFSLRYIPDARDLHFVPASWLCRDVLTSVSASRDCKEFLRPMGISQYRLAKDISVPPRRINEIVLKKRSITADTALRLGRFFGIPPQFWLNLQSRYDLEVTEDLLAGRLEKEVHILKSNAA